MAERVGLFAAGRPLIPRFARDRPSVVSHPLAAGLAAARRWPRRAPRAAGDNCLAERVGFEPTCRFYPTIRFRVGAVMTASVPLRRSRRNQGAAILAETPCVEWSFLRALSVVALLIVKKLIARCAERSPAALDVIRARG